MPSLPQAAPEPRSSYFIVARVANSETCRLGRLTMHHPFLGEKSDRYLVLDH